MSESDLQFVSGPLTRAASNLRKLWNISRGRSFRLMSQCEIPGDTMAVIRRKFFEGGREGGGDEWYYLARNTEGDVFVFHEWSNPSAGVSTSDSEHIELAVFLAGKAPARDALRAMIGSLVPGEERGDEGGF